MVRRRAGLLRVAKTGRTLARSRCLTSKRLASGPELEERTTGFETAARAALAVCCRQRLVDAAASHARKRGTVGVGEATDRIRGGVRVASDWRERVEIPVSAPPPDGATVCSGRPVAPVFPDWCMARVARKWRPRPGRGRRTTLSQCPARSPGDDSSEPPHVLRQRYNCPMPRPSRSRRIAKWRFNAIAK